jgi:putative GTP pyrophosphokinase
VQSKKQIDKLGERLWLGPVTADDLRLLDDYRRSFAPASSEVTRVLRGEFQLDPTAREAKSSRAILAKLGRSTTTLSTMQDIAGCRVVVGDRKLQRSCADALQARYPQSKLIDRIARPSFGYRALHLVVKIEGKSVEVQLRTVLQHLWAQLCEHLSDQVGVGLKYGNGPVAVQSLVTELSDLVWFVEEADGDYDMKLVARMTQLTQTAASSEPASELRQLLDQEFARLFSAPSVRTQ